MRRSVLDLGSNSFHVLVADLDGDGSVVPVGREREMLHLGAVVAEHGHVPADHRRRAVEVVAHLTELAGRLGAQERLAVATSALRDAANGPEVVAEMEAATGTRIRVIDGVEEAQLAYRGVRAAVAVDDEPLLVLDLGGGSLELVVGTADAISWSTSLDLGVSRLSASLHRDPPKKKEVAALQDCVRTLVAPWADRITDLEADHAVAIGGTVRALARVVAAESGTWLPATLNQFTITRDAIEDLRDRLVRMDADDRADVKGMKSRRADRIHVAAIILATTLDTLGLDRFRVSDWGLREGTLLDAVDATAPASAVMLRRREIERMHRQFAPTDAPAQRSRDHQTHVADLAVRLFDGTRELHGMDDADRERLWCGAALHDVGESLALRAHHRHGAYVIEHAELRGFAPDETAMLCCLARFHRSRGLSRSFAPYDALSKAARRRVERMVALLQVADGLDRARDQAVTDLTIDHHDGRVDVALHGGDLHVAEAEVERKTRLFERVFDVDVHVRAART